MSRKGAAEIRPWTYDLFMWSMELAWFGKWRKRILQQVRGDVLDIGSGTGTNFKFYPDTINCVSVIDPSKRNLEYLKKRAAARGWSDESGKCLKTFIGIGEELPFGSGAFDFVVSTLILCSVQDPSKVISEGTRVLKRGGRFIFIEHQIPQKGPQGSLFNFVTPGWRMLSGCNLNRHTEMEIGKCDQLEEVHIERKGPILGYPFFIGVYEKI
jgi:ubiquinone/menaquinone biosynthesis C-methylase UbiE